MEEKLHVINPLHSGVTVKTVASKLAVGKRTVGDSKKNQAEIEEWRAAKAIVSGMKKKHTER